MSVIDGSEIWSIWADAVTTIKTVTDFQSRVFEGPPEVGYAEGPWCYLEYGPGMVEQGSEEVIDHQIEANVLIPMGATFDTQYGVYTRCVQLAYSVHRAFFANVMVHNEAAISSNTIIAKPDLLQYGEVRLLRCKVTMHLTTTEDVSALTSV